MKSEVNFKISYMLAHSIEFLKGLFYKVNKKVIYVNK
jgi:hypothetical protein